MHNDLDSCYLCHIICSVLTRCKEFQEFCQFAVNAMHTITYKVQTRDMYSASLELLSPNFCVHITVSTSTTVTSGAAVTA